MSDINVRMTLTDDVSAKMRNISSAARSAQSQLTSTGKALDNAFTSNAPSAFASDVSSAVGIAEGSAEGLGNTLDGVFSQFDRASSASSTFTDAASDIDSFAESAEEAGESVAELSETAEKLDDSMDGIEDGADNFDELSDGAKKAGTSMDDVNSKAVSLTSVLKTLFAAVSAAAIVKSVGSYVSDSIDVGSDYSSMISEVSAISGASDAEMATLTSTAREYGATTVFSATEAAEALKYMSLAGWSATESTEALGGVLDLAAASGMELGSASDMVTDYLSAFSMDASQASYFADMLAYAQSNSNTTVEQLGEAFQNSAANMNAYGQDVETTTSLLEAMANQGYKGARAGTSLAAMMRDITNSMEDGAIMIGDTSVAVSDAQGNYRDLTDILADVEDATSSMGDAEKASALSATFTSDSIKGVNMILAEGVDTVAGYEEELRNASGTASDMADTMNDNLEGDKAAMNSAFEEMQLQTYEAMEEPLRQLTQWLTDSVIPTLTEWVPDAFETIANGASKIGNAITPMIETILKNPGTVATVFGSMAAGFAAMKGVNTAMSIANKVTELGGMSSALSTLSNKIFGSPWAAGAAAITAAVVAIGLAIKKYNDTQISNSLEEHFGNIELTAEQIEDVAGHILNAEYMVNVNAALNKITNADELADEAEAALEDNDALEWKAALGIEWDESEIDEYVANVETYIEDKVAELEDRTYAVSLTVDTMLAGTEEGETLSAAIEEWAIEDEEALDDLSQRLSSAVESAMEDGVLDADEQAAISILQTKMNNILTSWTESDDQAAMDLMSMKYGDVSGADLLEGTYEELVEELAAQREENASALDESYTELMSTLRSLDNSGRLEEAGMDFDSLSETVSQAYRNANASSLANSLNFESNTLSDTYGEKLDQNLAAIESNTSNFLSNANDYLENEDYGSLLNSLQNGYLTAMTGTNVFSDADQKALSQLYESMEPDVSEMQSLIDQYREAGQQIPTEVATAFNEAMEIGAAAGDTSAAWQVFATEMVADPANEALVQAIQDGTVAVPEELADAIETAIALTDTSDETIDMGELAVGIAGVDLDVEEVAELTGYTVEEVQAIFDEMGLSVSEEVDVTTEEGSIDTSGAAAAGAAAQDAAQSAVPGETLLSTMANVTVEEGTTDTSKVGEIVANASASVATQTITSDAVVNVEAEQGTDNFSTTANLFSTKFGTDLDTAFNKTFTTTTDAKVTVNYALANPTATISFSGGGSGTATVSASLHAAGGIFDTPHLGMVAEEGPEAIIPLDGSGNAFDLWRQAGEALGLLNDDAVQVVPSDYGGNSGSGGNQTASNRTVDININGSGTITAGGGLSKDDIVDVLMDKARQIFVDIVEEEALVGGDSSYEF